MLKPTEHYDGLREALTPYRKDPEFESPVECWAHILLDLQAYIGDTKQFYAAVKRSGELAIEQHHRELQALDEIAKSLKEPE